MKMLNEIANPATRRAGTRSGPGPAVAAALLGAVLVTAAPQAQAFDATDRQSVEGLATEFSGLVASHSHAEIAAHLPDGLIAGMAASQNVTPAAMREEMTVVIGAWMDNPTAPFEEFGMELPRMRGGTSSSGRSYAFVPSYDVTGGAAGQERHEGVMFFLQDTPGSADSWAAVPTGHPSLESIIRAAYPDLGSIEFPTPASFAD